MIGTIQLSRLGEPLQTLEPQVDHLADSAAAGGIPTPCPSVSVSNPRVARENVLEVGILPSDFGSW